LGNGGCSISFYGFTISLTEINLTCPWNMDGTKISKVKLPTKDIYMIICGFWGVNIENDKEDSFDSFNTTAVVGIRF
jgi:hypothetical protein